MGNSLQDQFLKLGLVDKKNYNKAKKDKHQKKIQPENQKDEIAEMARRGLAEKKKRDQQLNKKKIAEREAKEATARARQLIEKHQITFENGDIPYNFKFENKIKKIYLPQAAIDSLVKGKTGIVKLAGEFKYVPADTIYKIRELNDKMVVMFNAPADSKSSNADDPYSEFEVPDDLMW